jgi:alpha-L-fucosidase
MQPMQISILWAIHKPITLMLSLLQKQSKKGAFIFLANLWLFFPASGQVRPPAAVLPVPSAKQLQYHEMEMNAFIHFTTNTFTDLEWGMGDEQPTIFNPTAFDPNQWMEIIKSTGFKGVVLTTKHHDGFCLWPSKYTEHSVGKSPYKNGKGDVVKEVSDACRKVGLKFGVYLSPWDRNRADYGNPSYVNYYRNQLKELFTGYGPIFEMWFDGANGGKGYYGGANETRKINSAVYYEWPTTLQTVRNIQPNVLFFSDAGPDIRWVGNERGVAGLTNWNTITKDTLHAGKPGIENLLNQGTDGGKHWIPAEVDVSIRPGWFYHQKEDSLVKTPQKLFEIYLTSVGRGSTLLLNLPPDRRGLIHENDIKSLQGFRKLLDQAFTTNYAIKANVTASNTRGNDKRFQASGVVDGNKNTYWATDDGVNTGSIELTLAKKVEVKYIVIQEYIKLGQRIRSFSVEAFVDGAWKEVAAGTTIGYKNIQAVSPVQTDKLRIHFKDSKAPPVISNIEIY